MTNFRKMLLSTAAIGLTSVAVSSAYAAEVEKKFAWSGQVNRAISMVDDGQETTTAHSDPTLIGQSRARMVASAKSDSMTIGAYVELAMSQGSNSTSQASGSDSFKLRHSAVNISNSMGQIIIGQTAHADEAFTGVRMDGVGDAIGHSGGVASGMKFFNTTTKVATAQGVTAATAHGGAMSTGRKSGISYKSPTFNGFKLHVSHSEHQSGSGNIQYGGDFGGIKVKAGAGLGYLGSDTIDQREQYGVGFKLANGLSLGYSYRTEELASLENTANNSDPHQHFLLVGMDLPNVSALGNTAVAVAYRDSQDQALNGDDYKGYSFLVQQSLSDYGTSVYGGFQNLTYDTTLNNFDDIRVLFMGMKVKF
jgi:hypothetical protein